MNKTFQVSYLGMASFGIMMWVSGALVLLLVILSNDVTIYNTRTTRCQRIQQRVTPARSPEFDLTSGN